MNAHLAPWNLNPDEFPADSFASDQLEFLLGYAVLAPSTHNSQPWLFRINAMDVELFADRRRMLPVIDPGGRELVMSCGAALMNLRVAAEYFGHVYKVDILPDVANRDLLARFHLGLTGDTSSEDILEFHAITRRRTNRQAFRPDPVPEPVLQELVEAARREGAVLQVMTDESAKLAVAELVAEADKRQWADTRFRQELSRWVRTKLEEYRDGLTAHSVGVRDWMSFAGPSLIRLFDRGGGEAARDHEIALHSPALAVLSTEADDLASWMTAGQALQSVLLSARSDEVWASFLNQPVEIPELRARLAEVLGSAAHPQALIRLGYGDEAPPTPRRGVREVLITHQRTHA
jgi:nitroreductase